MNDNKSVSLKKDRCRRQQLWEVQTLRVVRVAYAAGAKTAVGTAFRANLRTGIGSMAVTLAGNVKSQMLHEWREKSAR